MFADTVKDIMTTEVITVPENMPVKELATFLVEQQISGAPVVTRAGHLVGVVSLENIAESAAEGFAGDREVLAPYYQGGWERRMSREDLAEIHLEDEGLVVRDIMNPTIYSVTEETPVRKVARTMYTGRIHRVLVTRNEKLVGIATSLDLVKLLCGESS